MEEYEAGVGGNCWKCLKSTLLYTLPGSISAYPIHISISLPFKTQPEPAVPCDKVPH